MGIFNQYPNTDMSDINLDWVLNNYGTITAKAAEASDSAEAALTAQHAAEAAQSGAEAEKDLAHTEYINALNSAGDSAESAADAVEAQHAAEAAVAGIGNVTQQVATNTARIAQIVAGGSVDPDAELTDIRVMTSGYTAESAGDAVRKQVKQAFLGNSDFYQIIADNTDFDTLTTVGNYKVTTFAHAGTMTHIPDVNGGKLYVYNTSQADRCHQLWITSNAFPLRMFIRQLTATGWNAWERILTPGKALDIVYNNSPAKVRLMEYNLGKFNNGRDHSASGGVPQDELPERIAKFKRMLGYIRPDILGLNEYTDYIDKDDSVYATDATLFDDIFNYEASVGAGCTTKLQYKVLSDAYHNIALPGSETLNLIARLITAEIAGRTFKIITGYFRVQTTSAQHIAGFNTLLSDLSSDKDVIIMLDSNYLSNSEKDTIVTAAQAAGYHAAQGGYFGDLKTLNEAGSYANIDSIFVKGRNIKIVNAFVPDVGDTLMSDHMPIVADIIIGGNNVD